VYARQGVNPLLVAFFLADVNVELLLRAKDAIGVVMNNATSKATRVWPCKVAEQFSDRTWKYGAQSADREIVFRAGGRTLRARVHCDFHYQHQGWGKIEMWADGWREVHTIPGAALRTQRVPDGTKPGDFDKDLEELVAVAAAILDIE
jgi:hypothetical protein